MKKILIIDDKKELRQLVEITLRSEDYKILQAGDGKEGIEIAKAERPDLILMDIMMPGDMSGLEATKALKNDPETKNIPIIMLTAQGQQQDREIGLEAGADDYFTKPFRPLELIKKVDEILGS